MTDFMIHFLFCNIFISGIIIILTFVKQILKTSITSRIHYNLWLLLLGLLVVPFIPFRLIKVQGLLSWLSLFTNSSISSVQNMVTETTHQNLYPS